MKLKGPAKGPIPYRIYKDEGPELDVPTRSGKCGSVLIDFCIRDSDSKCILDPKPRNLRFPKTFKIAKLSRFTEVSHWFLSARIATISKGSSGSSILESDLTYPTLVGILVTGQESEKSLETILEQNCCILSRYTDDEEKWSAYQVPVAGDFLRTILKARTRSPTHSEAGLLDRIYNIEPQWRKRTLYRTV